MRRAPSPAAMIAACEAAGLSRRAIASAAQLSPAYVTRLAQGDRGQHIGNAAMEGLQRALDHAKKGEAQSAQNQEDAVGVCAPQRSHLQNEV